jgi:transcriptional regulator with XRE-family HTH domain
MASEGRRRPPRRTSRAEPLTIKETIGSRIRGYREQAGLRQDELAHAVGLPNTTALSKIENGKTKVEPSHELLGRIALALRSDAAPNPILVQPEDFVRDAGYEGLAVKIVGVTARADARPDPT